MTDGPYYNLDLAAHHRKLVKALGNAIYSDEEQYSLMGNVILKDMLTPENVKLIKTLYALANDDQLDLGKTNDVIQIFAVNDNTPFANTLKKKILNFLNNDLPLKDALDDALRETCASQKAELRERLCAALLHNQHSEGLSRKKVTDLIRKVDQATETLPGDKLFKATRSVDKNAFKEIIAKRKGVEDGPPLPKKERSCESE